MLLGLIPLGLVHVTFPFHVKITQSKQASQREILIRDKT